LAEVIQSYKEKPKAKH